MTSKQKRAAIKEALKIVLPVMLLFGFPILSFLIGFFLLCSYQLMNLMMVFPALSFIDFVILAVPLAAAFQMSLVRKICTLVTFKGKRNLLYAIRQSRQLNFRLYS